MMLECQICDISESPSCMQGLVTVLVAVKLGTWSSRESNLPWSAKVMRFMIKHYIRRCFSIEPSLWPVSLLCFINMKLKCYLHCIKRQDVGKWISIEQPCSVTRVVQFLWRTTLQRSSFQPPEKISAQNTWLRRYLNLSSHLPFKQSRWRCISQQTKLGNIKATAPSHRGTLQISQWHGGWRAEPQDDSQGDFFRGVGKGFLAHGWSQGLEDKMSFY